MAKPDKLPRWADVDPATNVLEPPEPKKDVGWVKEEKPPARFMNWLFYKIYQWLSWLAAQAGGDDLRSNNPLVWSGSELSFTAPIQLIFREEGSVLINQIPISESPIALSDGEVLVVFPDKNSPSPVDLMAGTYGALSAGQYAIIDEASLTADNSENELILFRRRDVDSGDDEYANGYAAIEIPFTNQMIFPSSRFYLGGKNFDGQNVYDGDKSRWYSNNGVTQTVEIDGATGIVSSANMIPIGGIIAFDNYNISGFPALSPNWAFLNGQTINDPDSPFDGITLKDASRRYLVGYGTDGGGNIGTASFSATPVGNAGHSINLAHTHSVPGHSHTVNSHTHSLPAHTHSISSDGSHSHGGRTNGMSSSANEVSTDYRIRDDGSGWVNRVGGSRHIAVDPGSSDEGQHDHVISTDGAHSHGSLTGSGGSGTSGSAAPGTSSVGLNSDSSLSTVSIQPRSIEVRWIMRIK